MENNFTTLTVNPSATIHTPEPTPTISKINVPSQKLIPSATENNSSASQDDYSASPNESSSSPKFTSPTSTMNQESVTLFHQYVFYTPCFLFFLEIFSKI